MCVHTKGACRKFVFVFKHIFLIITDAPRLPRTSLEWNVRSVITLKDISPRTHCVVECIHIFFKGLQCQIILHLYKMKFDVGKGFSLSRVENMAN